MQDVSFPGRSRKKRRLTRNDKVSRLRKKLAQILEMRRRAGNWLWQHRGTLDAFYYCNSAAVRRSNFLFERVQLLSGRIEQLMRTIENLSPRTPATKPRS